MTGPPQTQRVDHRRIGVLGALTICAYGGWYYSFGVLLDPIIEDTGWRESTLAASFSAGVVIVGVMALAGGSVLDRSGHRVVFTAGAILVPVGLVIASMAQHVAVFFVASAIGLGAAGALGFYHVTMATAVRLHHQPPDPAGPPSPEHSTPVGDRAIAVLTIWGAFASAIFLPLTAALESSLGWRGATRVLAAMTGVAFAVAALALPTEVDRSNSADPPRSLRHVIAAAFTRRETRLFSAAVALGGISMQTLLVYQVPSMTALGVSAGAASAIAGFRGLCQLLGRLPITPILDRLGIDRSLALSFVAMASGGVLLAVSSTVAVGVMFAIVAGFGIGAFSPLQGMKAAGLFARNELGAAMGFYGTVLVLAGSLGPLIAGLAVEATGERRWAAAIVAVTAAGAWAAVAALGRDLGASSGQSSG